MSSDNDIMLTNVIRVEKEHGSKLISYLKDLNLLNENYKIDKDETNIYIPIVEILPSHAVFNTFDADIIQMKMRFKVVKLKSLRDYLSNQIPNELLDLIPSSYDIIGQLVVVDIKDEVIDFKPLIGSAIRTLHPSINSVYAKTSSVKGPYRIRELELISGEENSITIHKEYDLRIYLDLSKIYFSPRLSTEHHRIALLVNSSENILDLFAASGVFALHIAKLVNAQITSLDLNPDAEILLTKSMELNKTLKGQIIPKTGDAREIIKRFLEQDQYFDRIIMNHPSAAIDYLNDAFKLLKINGIVHLYLFSLIDDAENYCATIVNEKLGTNYEIINVHHVRQFSPSEYHSCITIKKLA